MTLTNSKICLIEVQTLEQSPSICWNSNLKIFGIGLLPFYIYAKYMFEIIFIAPFIARCDIGVQLSVRPSVHNLCQGAYSVAVIAGSMKPCIVITLDTHFKKAP